MSNKFIAPFFPGTYPADVVPKVAKTSQCWIWNTQGSDKGGEHWVGIWVNDKKMIFFDSFGLDVKLYQLEKWKK